MHVHLGFIDGARECALDAHAAGALLFSCTVTPDEYLRHIGDARSWTAPDGGPLLGRSVFVGVGLHPWWVAEATYRDDLELIGRIARTWACGTPAGGRALIGETGLDFAPRHEATRDMQVEAFEYICGLASDAAARGARPVLSIHAVHSATTVLDILEKSGCLARRDDGTTRAVCILHWFSGKGDELTRAVRSGCRFSVGPRMVETKRGREYARQIPVAQLLLETDDPPGENVAWPFDRVLLGLQTAFDAVAELRGATTPQSSAQLARALDANARGLLVG